MIEIYKVLFVGSAIGVALYAFYGIWRLYGIYRMLGDHVRGMGFYWFSFQFQHETFARGFPYYVDYLDGLPDDLKARVIAARTQFRYRQMFIICWIVAVLSFGWLASKLAR
jgi:hypothetical protein